MTQNISADHPLEVVVGSHSSELPGVTGAPDTTKWLGRVVCVLKETFYFILNEISSLFQKVIGLLQKRDVTPKGEVSQPAPDLKKMSGSIKLLKLPMTEYDVTSPQGEKHLQAVLSSMQNDPQVSDELRYALFCMKSDPKLANSSDLLLAKKMLEKGSCFGQVMNILEILSSHPSCECTESFLAAHMDPEKSMRYQILHFLIHLYHYTITEHVHNFGRELPDLPSWTECTERTKKLEKLFPCSSQRKISSEQIALKSVSEQDLAGRISDYLKLHITSQNENEAHNDFAVVALLAHSRANHAALIYSLQKNKKYYWYEPSLEGGIFSATDFRTFLCFVSSWLLHYKAPEDNTSKGRFFSHVSFTAYDLKR